MDFKGSWLAEISLAIGSVFALVFQQLCENWKMFDLVLETVAVAVADAHDVQPLKDFTNFVHRH